MTAIRIRIAVGIVMALACLRGSGQSGGKQPVPRFEEYKVAKLYRGVVRPPIFGEVTQYEGTDLRCFSGDSSNYSKEPVNFAGRFVNESCSCGSGCHYLFMWDAPTGRFYRIPV